MIAVCGKCERETVCGPEACSCMAEKLGRTALRITELEDSLQREQCRNVEFEAQNLGLCRELGKALIVPTLAAGEDLAEPSDHAIVHAMLQYRARITELEQMLESILTDSGDLEEYADQFWDGDYGESWPTLRERIQSVLAKGGEQ